MARKKRQEEHVNHERWLVSYADFITLLFAFFVVLYSISSVNEGKYRVLSDTLESAFKNTGKADKPIQIGVLARTLNPFNTGVQAPEGSTAEKSLIRPIKVTKSTAGEEGNAGAKRVINALEDELRNSLAALLAKNLVTIRKSKYGLEVELKSRVLFEKSSARLSIAAEKLLIDLAATLSKFPTSMQVEGHTDATPINSVLYPSNWELSSARAATVVNLFVEHDMDPERIWAIGYAQYRPYSSINSAIEIEQNRRISLIIRANVESRTKPFRTDESLNTSGFITPFNAIEDATAVRGERKSTLIPIILPELTESLTGDSQ